MNPLLEYIFIHTHLIIIACGLLVQDLPLLVRGLGKQFALQKVLHAVVDLVRATLDRFLFVHFGGRWELQLVAPLLALLEGQVLIVLTVDVRVAGTFDGIP